MDFRNRDEWEEDLLLHATLFTVVRHLSRGQQTRQEFATLAQAIAEARPDQRAMVYAVTERGDSFMLARSQWERATTLLEERKR